MDHYLFLNKLHPRITIIIQANSKLDATLALETMLKDQTSIWSYAGVEVVTDELSPAALHRQERAGILIDSGPLNDDSGCYDDRDQT